MSETSLSMHDADARRIRRRGVAGVLAATALAAAPMLLMRNGIHAPDLSPVLAAPARIQIHMTAALAALAIGSVLMMGVKGGRAHRVLGWSWVIAMAVTAVSSLFIRGMNHGAMSWIHLLSGWTIIALPMGVYAARRHKVRLHGRFMTGLFVGGLLIAGAFTFLPGRLMWRVFFG